MLTLAMDDAQSQPSVPALPIEDAHDLMCKALVRAGGVLCEEMLKPVDGVKIADVAFLNDQLVIEVKTLASDRNKLESVRKKARSILDKWAASGHIPHMPGAVSVNLGDLPAEVAEDLLRNVGNRIATELTNANRQIKQTMERLGYSHPVGLVIIITPWHFASHVGVIGAIAGRNLKGTNRRGINGVLAIEIISDGDNVPDRGLAMVNFTRTEMVPANPVVVGQIVESWRSTVSEHLGVPFPREDRPEGEFERMYLAN